MNDSELVQGLRDRNPAAMQWLSSCYLPSLWRFVYTRVNGDQHLAEDITSETILAMLTAIESKTDVEIQNPGGWLRTVAGRRITDHFRAVSRVQHLLTQSAYQTEANGSPDPAQNHELEETRAEVRQAMDGLPDQYRIALEWKYLDQLSVREMAERWSVTEKAAESILFRARREFRDRMQLGEQAAQPPVNGKRVPSLEVPPGKSAQQDTAHSRRE